MIMVYSINTLDLVKLSLSMGTATGITLWHLQRSSRLDEWLAHTGDHALSKWTARGWHLILVNVGMIKDPGAA